MKKYKEFTRDKLKGGKCAVGQACALRTKTGECSAVIKNKNKDGIKQ